MYSMQDTGFLAGSEFNQMRLLARLHEPHWVFMRMMPMPMACKPITSSQVAGRHVMKFPPVPTIEHLGALVAPALSRDPQLGPGLARRCHTSPRSVFNDRETTAPTENVVAYPVTIWRFDWRGCAAKRALWQRNQDNVPITASLKASSEKDERRRRAPQHGLR